MSSTSSGCCPSTFATTMKIGRISDSRRIRQPVDQSRSDLALRAQSTPSRDSVDCTIVTPLQLSLRQLCLSGQLLSSHQNLMGELSSGAEPADWSNIGPKQRITHQWSDTARGEKRFPVRDVLTNHRTRRASEVLRLNLLDVELRYALAHCFQNIFERWRLALDPSQRVDARYNKRSQIRTHESALFQLLDYGGDLFLELEHHRGPLLVLLKRRT